MTVPHLCAVLTLLLSLAVSAQEAAPGAKQKSSQPAEEELRIESEFVASDIFRSGTLVVRVWRGLHAEGEYFGVPEGNIGITGASWKFRWKRFSISPGLAASFGSNVNSSPVFTVRWTLDTERWFSQGFWAQDLTPQTEHFEGEDRRSRSAILDNNHISVRIWRLEIGGLWEHIKYREENEWKGGIRVAGRFGRSFKVIFQSVGPDVEYRGGIAFER